MTSPRRRAIFTICSSNYMPFAHVLLESVRRFHPEAALFVCLADRRPDGLIAGPGLHGDWTVVAAEELAVPDFPCFAFRYDIMEFNTALKPFMFRHLFEVLGFDEAIYLDPDIQLFAPLRPVVDALAAGASFVFTPHLCTPNEDRTEEPNDLSMLRAGAYNLGFLGAGRTAETAGVLAWWARRLEFQCVNAQADGLFVDQKFMDLVPGFAPGAVICHDTTLNVAYWNLPQRVLAQVGDGWPSDGWTVDGAPLTFFHFSGFNPRDLGRLSRHDGRFVGVLPGPLQALTAQYAARLLAAGHGGPAPAYAYGRFGSGTPIPAVVRRMFRAVPWPGGNPFDGFEAFLDQPAPGAVRTGGNQVLTNLARFLGEALPLFHPLPGLPPATRRDLADPAHVDALLRWFAAEAADAFGLDPVLVAAATWRLGHLRPLAASIPPRGADEEMEVTVTAPLQAGGEASQAGRGMFRVLLGAGVATEMLDGTSFTAPGRGGVQVLCLDAAQMGAGLADTLGQWAARCPPAAVRILVPASHPQPADVPALDLVHEVWAPSPALQAALASRTGRPVIHMPPVQDGTPDGALDGAGLLLGRLRALGRVGEAVGIGQN